MFGRDKNTLSEEQIGKQYDQLVNLIKVGQIDTAKLKDLINLKTEDGLMMIHIAAGKGDIIEFEKLLEAGAKIAAVTKDGYTTLHFAAGGGNYQVFQKVLQAGGNMNAVTKDGYTTLHFAAEGGNYQVFQKVLQAGGNMNAVTKDGYTVFSAAVEGESFKIVKTLAEAGIKTSVEMESGIIENVNVMDSYYEFGGVRHSGEPSDILTSDINH